MDYKAYLRLMRPKHYLKNLLIFFPLVFGGRFFNGHYFLRGLYSFIAFSMIASAIYVFNDIRDVEYDIHHPKKKLRPIAAGLVSISGASVLIILLLIVAAIFQSLAGFSFASVGMLLTYLLINVLYALGLKNLPIIDVAILSFGFVIRVLYGGYSTGISISKWLFLTILAFSFYLGLGKRRNEIKTNGTLTRKVNKFYNQDFLDKNMFVFLGLTIIYYSLWAVDPAQTSRDMVVTIPVVIMITMLYSLTVEGSHSDGDPINVLLNNKALLVLTAFYVVLVTCLIYIK